MIVPWRDKANRVIAELCRSSFLRANTRSDGKRYKKHQPYVVPPMADLLVQCLNRDDELTAKVLFHQYHLAGVNQ